ncbi:MAG: 16S rRNA (uracil(1498)-N(3))-methyltransferase [Burkholderiaceae bacterium]
MIPRVHWPLATAGLNVLGPEASHHLIRVLRLSAGDAVALFNGQGLEAQGRILNAHAQACQVVLEPLVAVQRESPIRTVVIQSLCLADKMDWVVQKATELGAAEIWPVQAARSQLQLSGERATKRQAHWQRVVESAAAQCGRNHTPVVHPVTDLNAALNAFTDAGGEKTGWLLDPFGPASVSQAALKPQVWVAIGPEAGWTDQEEREARASGFQGLRLGPRVLRTETVASAILSVIAVRALEF